MRSYVVRHGSKILFELRSDGLVTVRQRGVEVQVNVFELLVTEGQAVVRVSSKVVEEERQKLSPENATIKSGEENEPADAL